MLNAKEYYNIFSNKYDYTGSIGYLPAIDRMDSDIVIEYAHGKNALEVGCGTGLIMEKIKGGVREIRGIDISPNMLARARARKLNVIEGSALDMPFQDNTFDVSYSLKVLPHIKEIKKAISEMVRVTKNDGNIVMEFYNPISLRGIRLLIRYYLFPLKINNNVTEADLFNRIDPPWRIKKYLPDNVEIVDTRGVMIFALLPFLYRVPLISRALIVLERIFQKSPLKYFGGFYIVVVRKK